MPRAARSLPTPDGAPESGRAPASFGDYLGPAEVTEARGPTLEVELSGGERVPATIALALPYEPVVGDTLLVIGRGEACYVIGVLHGQGRTSLAFHGDVELASLDGKVIVTGQRGVELRGPEVDVHAGTLRMVAGAVVQRFASVCQRVTEILSVHARESHTLVDEGSFAQAKRSVLQTEETVTINGKEIHLG
jgi:Protein of unknown function (DUF3540)